MKSLRSILSENLPYRQKKIIRSGINYLKTLGAGDDLTRLAKVYGTDKWGGHYYTPHYRRHFRPFRKKRINLLEIGIGGYDRPRHGGQSLRMWKRFFPRGTIYGIDRYDKSDHEEHRIRTFQGDQTDRAFLEHVADEIGEIDLIIDDGSHVNEHVIRSFEILFPRLKRGGIYVVEDTQTSYWGEYGGSSEDLNADGTSMNFLKGLIDGLNHKEFERPGYSPDYYDRHIVSMHFYHNLVFVHKGLNDEESNIMADNRRV